MLKGKKFVIINLGCKANKYESDAMTDKLKQAGMFVAQEDDIADVYVVNTCSVTNVAEKKSRQMLRRAKKKNKNAIVIAAGCYVNASPEQIAQMDFVDLIIGNNRKNNIVEILEQYFDEQQPDNYVDINQTNEYEEMGKLDVSALDHQRAYIKIQDGCNQFCSYCLIPYTRGRVRSRKPEHILDEIDKLAKSGVKEFVLTGIHISSYGLDFVENGKEYNEMYSEKVGTDSQKYSGKTENEMIGNLGELVHAISLNPIVERIRLGSLEPRIINENFLDLITKNDKVCPHFHLSLQSACNDTLKRMNRKYTIEEYEEKCSLLRKYYSNPAITTDVIVGFPGETDDEFSTTVKNLKRINLYEIHVFKYSVRTGTVAAKLPDQVPENVKAIRSDILLELTRQQKTAYEDIYSNKKEYVLIEEEIGKEDTQSLRKGNLIENDETIDTKHCLERRFYTGHTRNYIKVYVESDVDLTNQIVEVTLC